ncbi:MAG: Peptidase subtilisin kexin sedolisin [Bacteroidetes bacterium]|nr:Peptidase subtilisin kexin sedolisin [Bacteroidota bacterium]
MCSLSRSIHQIPGAWDIIGNLPLGSWVRDIAIAQNGWVFVAVQHQSNPALTGVYYSTNQGSVFTRIGGIASGDTVVSLIVVRDSSAASAGFIDLLCAGTANGKIYKAIIVGTLVFTLVHTITGDPEVATFWAIYFSAAVYIIAGGFDEGGGGGGVLQSIDRAASWAGIDQGLPPERKISAIAGKVASFVTHQLYAGMFRNQNNGASVYRRTITISDVKEGSSELPRGFALHQNYPNPFNPTTEIRFAVPVGTYGRTSLRVFDVLGREVATLVDEVKAPGEYSVTLDGSDLSSGVYFYRLRAGTFAETRKLMILR